MIAIKASAALMALAAVGFGAPTPFVARHLLREGKLPTFMGLFPMYGGGFIERCSPNAFVVMLSLFAALSTLELFASFLLWSNASAGARMALALLPFEIVFWVGFALPIPPIFAVIRVALLVAGWSSLQS